MIGDSTVGKSALSRRFAHDEFCDGQATIGVDFYTKTLEIDGKVVKIILVG